MSSTIAVSPGGRSALAGGAGIPGMLITACGDMAVAELRGSEADDDVPWLVGELPGGEDVGEPGFVIGKRGHCVECSILCEPHFEKVVA